MNILSLPESRRRYRRRKFVLRIVDDGNPSGYYIGAYKYRDDEGNDIWIPFKSNGYPNAKKYPELLSTYGPFKTQAEAVKYIQEE